MAEDPNSITIGILAMQGAFREHFNHIEKLNPLPPRKNIIDSDCNVKALLVRNPNDLARCQGLIIPGGESTAIALGAERASLLEPLRKWVRDGNPTWGTCAGMIMLAREASGIKKGGQELIGGIDVRVGRNGFGSQVESFEQSLSIPCLNELSPDSYKEAKTFPGVFIRAPIVDTLLLAKDLENVGPSEPSPAARGHGEPHRDLVVLQHDHRNGVQSSSQKSLNSVDAQKTLSVAPPLEQDDEQKSERPPLEILSSLPNLPRGALKGVGGNRGNLEDGLIGKRPEHDSMIIALKQGNLMCTSFHPELTSDSRLHEYFVRQCVLRQLA